MAVPARRFQWDALSDDELLDLRLCDLPLRIERTVLQERVERVYEEFERRDLRVRPHVWLGEEWFCPDGVPGFAIPFYLAHPRLMKLERRQMLEVEGGTERECLRIMRHEAGHAVSNAFYLHRRKLWRDQFGSFRERYPQFYKPDPSSRDYVLHLKAWYAQAHPAEDFAETFAVWLQPGSRWRRRYQDWGALKKLKYVAQLMAELSGQTPPNRRRDTVEPLSKLTKTLRQHYEHKRSRYLFAGTQVYDRDLHRVFHPNKGNEKFPTAVHFLRASQRELSQTVAEVTGVHTYAVDQVLENVIARCKELRLRVRPPRETAKRKVSIMLTAQTMKGVYAGYHRIPL
ncbi:MAG: putative zinc-binding metallopeptidase [Pyrinomonadaceae bacterium]